VLNAQEVRFRAATAEPSPFHLAAARSRRVHTYACAGRAPPSEGECLPATDERSPSEGECLPATEERSPGEFDGFPSGEDRRTDTHRGAVVAIRVAYAVTRAMG